MRPSWKSILLFLLILSVIGVMALAGSSILRERQARRPNVSTVVATQTVDGPAEALMRRGDVAFDQGDYEAAIAAYTAAIALNPNFAEAYNNRGLAYYRRNELDDALTDYDRALMLRPTYVNALTNRAIALFDKAEYDAVIADTSRAIEFDPNDDSAFVFRGNAYQRKGDYSRALGDWMSANAIRMERRGDGY